MCPRVPQMPGTDPWPLLVQLAPGPCPRSPVRTSASPPLSHVDLTGLHPINAQPLPLPDPCQTKGHRTAGHLGWLGLAGPFSSKRTLLPFPPPPAGLAWVGPESQEGRGPGFRAPSGWSVAAGRAPEPDKGPAGAFADKGSGRGLLSRLNTPNALQAPWQTRGLFTGERGR